VISKLGDKCFEERLIHAVVHTLRHSKGIIGNLAKKDSPLMAVEADHQWYLLEISLLSQIPRCVVKEVLVNDWCPLDVINEPEVF